MSDVTSVIGSPTLYDVLEMPDGPAKERTMVAVMGWARKREREAIDAFIRDELPGLLVDYDLRIEDTYHLLEGVRLTKKGGENIAAKIAELRK